jgi:hypothetical protein
MIEFETYPGSVQEVVEDRVSALRFVPGSNGYARFVTVERFVPPLRIAGWIKPREWSGTNTPDDPRFDGIHIHVGHVGNSRNYVCSLVRRDGGMKIAVEYGWRGYKSLDTTRNGPELVWERVYHFEVLWQRNKITTFLGNEMEVKKMSGKIPKSRLIPYGQVGLRLDNVDALGGLAIRQEGVKNE